MCFRLFIFVYFSYKDSTGKYDLLPFITANDKIRISRLNQFQEKKLLFLDIIMMNLSNNELQSLLDKMSSKPVWNLRRFHYNSRTYVFRGWVIQSYPTHFPIKYGVLDQGEKIGTQRKYFLVFEDWENIMIVLRFDYPIQKYLNNDKMRQSILASTFSTITCAFIIIIIDPACYIFK